MSSICNQTTRVTLEMPDGKVIDGLAHIIEIEHSVPYDGAVEWSMTLMGLADKPLWYHTRESAAQNQQKRKSALEWACDYCGAVWPKETTQCVQCGGWRSFLYDV